MKLWNKVATQWEMLKIRWEKAAPINQTDFDYAVSELWRGLAAFRREVYDITFRTAKLEEHCCLLHKTFVDSQLVAAKPKRRATKPKRKVRKHAR